MPTLVVQLGHCYRTTGATGTTGEQQYATKVGNACRALLHGRGGWSVRTILADDPSSYYRGDAFFAIHCDGSTSTSARGASVGYRTPEGQAAAQAWKRAYAARGWSGFRPDNYTTALAQYYGTGTAVAQGCRRAVILECGFRTNPTDRAALDSTGGPERVALSIGDALGIPTSPPEDDMPLTTADTNAVWMQDCTMTYADGTKETHPAAVWLTVMAVRISGLVGSVAGLTNVVAALSNDADLTADEVTAIVTSAVQQNMHITGTVTVTGA